MEFKERSITVRIDTTKCPKCTTKACVAACKTYNRAILQLENGVPSVSHLSPEEVIRRGTECLSCEYACWQRGLDVIRIEVPIKGLDDYIHGRPLLREV
jgi:Fe-S-cluster-containing dehydrogenase component